MSWVTHQSDANRRGKGLVTTKAGKDRIRRYWIEDWIELDTETMKKKWK
jgi:hypothetical protein